MTRISVIVPTFNRAADIARCLDSLVAQTFRDFEVLICDDGSTDDTANIVRRFEGKLDLAYHWAENFGGPARPRNAGLRQARGEYVAFLDSDDWWTPDKLQVSLEYLERGARFVYHDLWFATARDQTRFRRRSPTRPLRAPVFEDLLTGGNAINNSSVVVARDVMERIGGFSEERALIAGEDYDAWVRAGRVTDAFVRIPQVLGYYWLGTGSISNPLRTMTILEEVRRLYAADLARVGGTQWIEYTIARANYLLGKHADARAQLSRIDWRGAPLGIRARALITQLQLLFRRPA